MANETKIKLDIAILGGGFAGVYCAKSLEKKLGRNSGRRVGIVSSENHMVFQPMLPEVASGSISPRHVVNPLRLLCPRTEIYKGEIERILWPERKLLLNAGVFSGTLEIQFEHLVLALGAVVDLSRIPGMPEHAFLMRNVGDAMLLRSTLLNRLEEANLEPRQDIKRRLASFVVVGGGYSGVETAGQIADLFRDVNHFYPNVTQQDFRVHLVHSRHQLLPTLRPKLAAYTARELADRGVNLVLNQHVASVTASRVVLEDHSSIGTHTVISTVGNSPHPLVKKLCEQNGFESHKGRVLVSDVCQIKNQRNLWAAGDCAAVPFVKGDYCPATAQFAMRQGILVGENIARSLNERPLRAFTDKGVGEMASIGHRRAVGEIMGVGFSGFLAWWMWRTVYLSKLPRLDRKIRVLLDWTLDLFFPRDINVLNPRYSSLLKEVHLEKNDSLYRKGEPAFSFYIVKSGGIEVFDDGGIVQTISTGEYLGERALLGDKTWHFDARAAEPTTLVSIPAKIFDQIVGGTGSLGKLFQKSAGKYQSREIVAAMTQRLPEHVRKKTAADVMARDVRTLRPEMTVREALVVTKNFPHSSYPIVKNGGEVHGIVNREDFYEFLKRQDTTPDTDLKKVTPSALPSVRRDSSMEEIVERLVRSGANKLLVLDDHRHLAGIITVMDLVTTVQE